MTDTLPDRPAGLLWEQDPDLHTAIFDAADEAPSLLGLPAALARPVLGLPAAQDERSRDQAIAILAAARGALAKAAAGVAAAPIDLRHLPQAARALVEETLQSGEVTALIAGAPPTQVAETALTGLWRVRAVDEDGTVRADYLEAAAIPGALREAAEAMTVTDFTVPLPDAGAPGNAPSVLTEIRHAMAAWRPGEENHIISLTLLPMTEADLTLLGRAIGGGGIKLVSRGYGTVRATLTRARGVWQVEYLNAQDRVVVDTIEVGGPPAAILAAAEDFADSLERLTAMLDTVGG